MNTADRHLTPPGRQATVIAFPRRHREEPWVSKRQLAKHLGYSTRWVELRVREGMPNARLGSQRRFRVSEVEAWLADRSRA